MHRRKDVARTDAVDVDIEPAPFGGEHPRHFDDAPFAGVVRSVAVADTRRHRSGVDDLAALLTLDEVSTLFPRAEVGARKIDPDDFVPGFGPVILVAAEDSDPGVIDPDVEIAEPIDHRLNHRGDFFRLGHVALNEEGIDAVFFGDVGGGFFTGFHVDVHNRDVGARHRQSRRVTAADTDGRTGNQSLLSFETKHRFILSVR